MANSGDIGGRGKARDTTPEIEMAFFDELPLQIREALRKTSYDWPARDIYGLLSRGKTEEYLISQIKGFEAHLLAGRANG